MNSSLQADIIRRLVNDFNFKEQGEWLRKGVCPDCKKKELYTSAEHPWVLRCGRLNKCQAEMHIKEVYPDLFESWSDRYPPTKENPRAAADAYLSEMRGFTLSLIRGCYSQENYYDAKRDIGSATVRFRLADGVWWERIIDRPQRFGDRKASFHGAYGGMWWQPPSLKLEEQQEIWLVEGIFDAIALHHHGIAAVSIMSCSNYPAQMLNTLAGQFTDKKRPLLVWALDNDKAGISYTHRWVRRSREEGWQAAAAQTPYSQSKLDWNDLHQRERLTPEHLKKYRYYGALLIAPSPAAKALKMYEKTERKEFHFEFDNRLYWFKLDIDRYMKVYENIERAEEDRPEDELKHKALKESSAISEIANCYPTPLYFQKSEATDEAWYYLRIDFPSGIPPVKATFTAVQLASASEFKKRLLHVAKGAVYTGNTNQLDKLAKQELPKIKEVNTQNFIGYNKEFGAYVFNEVAVHNGTLYPLNDEDYFEMRNLSLKTLSTSPHLALNPDFAAFDPSWCTDLWRAFGVKGYIALAFWMGTLFAEQIRAVQKSFPFLEVVGEPGSGKSTLLEFLWRLSGRPDYEGFDPSKSTPVARARNFAQVGNLPVCLMEGDRTLDNAKLRAFDWDELKSLYNGRSPRAVGIKTNNNETYEPPFKGTIIIAQNANTDGSPAFLERIIHLHTDRCDQTPQTKAAAEALERYPIESISGFVLLAVLKEQEIMERFFTRFVPAEAEVLAVLPTHRSRIIKNHAQLIALLEALAMVLPLEDRDIQETRNVLLQMAPERLRAVQDEHPLVQEFWEAFDYLDSVVPGGINHAREPGEIAVQFSHFQEEASHHRQSHADIKEIKKLLEGAKGRPLLRKQAVRSWVYEAYNSQLPAGSPARRSEVQHCWVFKAQEG